MESLSRHPHRRRHSSKNSFSLKNPYDGVFLSNESLGVHDYEEIFSGSSSIPVLDLSELDERVGPADCGSSELDYANIFGGFRNDDVALPFEELFNGPAKKSKLRNTTRGDESGSIDPFQKPKMSFRKAPDKSTDGVKKQFNVPFNKTSQWNDELNGKAHIPQLDTVSGLACFVDENPCMQKPNDGKNASSLKREVSRTWSFSVELKGLNNTGELNSKNLGNVDVVKLNPNFFKAPSLSSCPSNVGSAKDPQQSMEPSYLVSEKDVPEKVAGDYLPPYCGDDYGENSVAAESVAALKRAIDQAQESIRIAKMIMDRKKEGFQNGPKPRANAHMKVSEKGDKVDNDSYCSRKNNTTKRHEELDDTPTLFNVTDGLFTQSFSQDDTFVSAPPVEVERILENDEAANEHRGAFSERGKLFSSNGSQREPLYVDEKIELEKDAKHVKAADMCKEESQLQTIEENIEKVVTMLCAKESERALDSSRRMRQLGKSVVESEQWCPPPDHVKEPEYMTDMVLLLNTSERTQEVDKVLGDAGKSFRISQDDEMCEDRENKMDGKGKEKLTANHFTFLRSEFDNFLKDSSDLGMNETIVQTDTQREPEIVSKKKKDGHIVETYDEEAHLWFESEKHHKESQEKKHNARDPQPIFQEKSVVERQFYMALNLDTPKQNDVHKNEPELPEEPVQNNTDERHVNSCEGEVTENMTTEAENCAEVEKIGFLYDSEESKDRIEENLNNFEYEDAFEEHVAEAVYLNRGSARTILSEIKTHDNSDDIGENGKACSDFDMDNNTGETHRPIVSFKDIDSTSEAIESLSGAHKDTKGDPLFHFEDDNDSFGTESLRRVASEEVFLSNKLHNILDNLPSDGQMENAGVMDADPKEELPEDEVSYETSEIHDVPQESSINVQNPFEFHSSNMHTSEYDLTEQISESDCGSVSTSIHENMDRISAQESEECAEGTDDRSPDSELPQNELQQNSDERDPAEEQREGLHSWLEDKLKQNSDERNPPEELREALHSWSEDELKPNSDERDPAEEQREGLHSWSQDELKQNSDERNPAEEQREGLHSWSHIKPEEMENFMESENNDENVITTSCMEDKDTKETEKHVESDIYNENLINTSAKENLQTSDKDDYLQRIAAIKRGREREKDRLAVERAIREARERAFAEARERAERAAVERVAAEARQRAKQTVDKSSSEAKIRAERAAVERATAEARERALEKAMSQKTTYADGRTTERVSGSSRSSVLKHSFSSSDLENGTESAQRRKARLERHQRIMERAAKALAEKNKRDLLVQKEQAERNRLAELLDAEIKRWATGKEGNLRALLSTLQYILGPDSGWQIIPLTEIVTTAAVKKAYRKATLYVHPDKLQQRGASIQQKYLCEKIFDLLKAAWNRFNSDER